LGRRMNEGAANLVDHVLPEVPIRQWVLTLPRALRFPLAFDGRLRAVVLRIFIDMVAGWYRKRQELRRVSGGACGAVAVIQRGSSDLRLNPHFHVLFLDGVCQRSRGRGRAVPPCANAEPKRVGGGWFIRRGAEFFAICNAAARLRW
jgi:hypothetical protein